MLWREYTFGVMKPINTLTRYSPARPGKMCTGVLTVFAACFWHQTPAAQIITTHEPRPSFDVATIKPSRQETDELKTRTFQGSFSAEHASLKSLLKFAYGLRTDDELLGLPGWGENDYFDVNAKIDSQTAQVIAKLPIAEMMLQTRLRVQTLLADRFHLTVATETASRKVYCLVVAQNGPKFEPAMSSTVSPDDSHNGIAAPAPPPPPGPGVPRSGQSPLDTSQGDRLIGRGASMGMLAQWLSNRPEIGSRTVVDQTGLRGRYDFQLTGFAPATASSPESADAAQPSVLTLLHEQLGLKLEAKPASIEVLVVKSVRAPSEN